MVDKRSTMDSVQQEKMWDFDYCEQYLRSVSNKILIMIAIRKANSHSVVICRLIKKSII